MRRRHAVALLLLPVALIVLKLGARAIFGETAAGHPGSGAMMLTEAVAVAVSVFGAFGVFAIAARPVATLVTVLSVTVVIMLLGAAYLFGELC